ncbi:MAG TPA: GNAT family N-acetyltransferase [Burkholderiales bacterium]|nr:GNAT family N-acetyltransferase [Burkholderiales bacterium]
MERLRIVESLAGVPAAAWNAIAGGDAAVPGDPFTRHEFISALIDTGCACARTGWKPQIVLLEREGTAGYELCGAMPMFLKSHSYGEYVFDWAWADAYQRHGFEYYPKLLCAVPFTPVTGPRLLASNDTDRGLLAAAAREMAQEVSSLHVLFPTAPEAALLQARGLLLRRTVQFHWQNAPGEGYADFDDFLARMTRHRRKVIRQERRRVQDAGVSFRWLRGAEIARGHWEFFERCYRRTYAAHHSSPYLKLDFFLQLGATLPQHTLLVLAERAGRPVAASLNLVSRDTLWGRYWGAVEHIPLLHFECCYYQAIEYAIAHRLRSFEGGAQGEHKLFRGLLPVETHSAHWLAHPAFASAIEDYLKRETAGLARYVDELNEHSPFRAPSTPPPA